ncbi:hypothetical protein N7509_010803 [Penicillium cosmopolitanum]|uniref:Uncharacterized protein n=1 Tax=Penicillium cosmopolitanum TaxID=1131564 RepID=A0A9W9VS30_9EURO|nr:uncharacterized protein N7509_010803 [Penicillium cosmopolitanum]KAJ5388262.1 hypothetical protein N7509_010803 [Penicillium cosmopolitanum]
MRPTLRYFLQSAKVATAGGAIGLGSFFIYTRNAEFTSIAESDPIFKLVEQKGWNPHRNPTTHDFYVRRVSLSDIRPELRDSPTELTKTFCAGVWSDWGNVFHPGFSIQRALLKRARNDLNQNHLWTSEDMLSSDYSEGTLIADSFEVLEKKDGRIVVRGGDSPSNKALRQFDVILELSTVIQEHEQAVDFGFKSIFFTGDKHSGQPPMPGFAVWLHLQYAKLLLETGILNTMVR